MSDDNSVTYREDCTEDGTCQGYAIIQGEKGFDFVSKSGTVLEISSETDPNVKFEDKPERPKKSEQSTVDRVPEPKNDASRVRRDANMTKRALSDDLFNSRVAKILYFVDEPFINEFLPLGGYNYATTILIIRDFLTLMTNQITTTYQTLRQYNQRLYVRGVSYDQDIAIQLVGVAYPTNQGQNFPFSANNAYGGFIYGLNDRGFLPDFAQYLSGFNTNLDYDHAAAITGYRYISGTTNNQFEILGKAYLGTMCEQNSFYSGTSASTEVLTGNLFNILAHQIGHGFGMNHDFNTAACPYNQYVMSPTYNRPWEFSPCSAFDLQSHTSSISVSNFKTTCLARVDPGFFVDFCGGFLGSQYSLDEQCQLSYGPNSQRCNLGQYNENQLRQGYVGTCLGEVFYCYPEYRDGYCYPITRALWGTKCVINNRLDPQNICYRETCQSRNICNTNPGPTSSSCFCSTRQCCTNQRSITGGCCSGCRGRTRGRRVKCSLKF